MKKEDYFNLFRNDIDNLIIEDDQIQSARYIIECNGRCNVVDCSLCAFCQTNSKSGKHCGDNGYSTIGTTKNEKDPLLLQTSIYFLEFKLGEKASDCKLINYNFF